MRNHVKVANMTDNRTTTHEGGVGYRMNLEESLAEFFSLGLLNGNFYQSQEEVLKNGKELFEKALATCPEFATKCAVYGNNVNSLKLVPTVWLVYLSTLEDKTLFKSAFPRIIRNPKMLHDFMEIVRKGGIRKGMGRGVKKVVNQWLLERMNPYQATRNKGKLSEITRVTRPAFQDEEFQSFMKYIAKDELTFQRAVALKKVLDALEEGVLDDGIMELIEAERLQLEELKHATKKLSQEQKKALYARMYQGLNYNALILNLVALERVYATKTHEVEKWGARGHFTQMVVDETDMPEELLEMVVERIKDVHLYRKSNMLPFALITAHRMVSTPEFKSAIADTIRKVAQEAFAINPDTPLMVGVDTSGSMSCMVNDSLTCIEIATLFGAMMKKSHTNTNVYAVASDIKRVPVKKQEDVFAMAHKIEETNVGHGTYFEQLMDKYQGEKYLILLTDSMSADNLEAKWLKAKKPEGAKLIVWQLESYQTKLSNDHSVVYLTGYSDRLLGLVKNIIEGKSGQLEEIRKIEV